MSRLDESKTAVHGLTQPAATGPGAVEASDSDLAPADSNLLGQVIQAAFGQPDLWATMLTEIARLGVAPAGWAAPISGRESRFAQAISCFLGRQIATLDAMISRQLNAILHHERFQRLEASWRGLRFLVQQAYREENVRIRILNVAWKELEKDLAEAETIEFDQTHFFRLVYSEEFATPGGIPFSVLIGDYFVGAPGEDHRDDVNVLQQIAQVAAAAFSPFIAAADPHLLGLEDFTQLERPVDAAGLESKARGWQTLRDSDDSRFVGLTVPRILMRLPYADDGSRADGFRFHEETDGRSSYLWGSAAWSFGGVLIRAFGQCGWLADIRGFDRDVLGQGLVSSLTVPALHTDLPNVAVRFPVETAIGDLREKDLADLGFIPLCHCMDTKFCVFYSNQSVQKPKLYDKPIATANARISAMLQYILCASRFAHYLKVLARDKVGAFSEATELESFLNNWLINYVAAGQPSAESRARFPLREAAVRVREMPGKAGSYSCVIHLLPHSQLDALTASISLKTELAPAI